MAVGYPPSLSSRSGYVSLKPECAERGIPLLEAEDINAPGTVDAIRASGGGLLLVTGWSQLLSRPLLELCQLGAVGMHPTRLPEGRGRAPIPWTLIKGLKRSAVTLFHLTEGVDDGDIVGQIEFDVADLDDAASLYEKICDVYVDLVREFVPRLLDGTAPRRPQDHARATYWPRRRPEDGRIDWTRPARELYNWVRGLTHPYPGAFTELRGERVTIWRALPPAADLPGGRPGQVVAADENGIAVACGDAQSLPVCGLSFGQREVDAGEVAVSGRVSVGDVLGGEPKCAKR
jgi:methionyl-tRNA formyltransferase